MRLLAIDPGTEKCGLAVLEEKVVVARAVVPTSQLFETLREWVPRYGVERILVGDRTGAEDVLRRLAAELPLLPVIFVAEQRTTLQARRRYFQDHPPQGWRRLLPVSMQLPPEPYDDYAAIIIAERYQESHA